MLNASVCVCVPMARCKLATCHAPRRCPHVQPLNIELRHASFHLEMFHYVWSHHCNRRPLDCQDLMSSILMCRMIDTQREGDKEREWEGEGESIAMCTSWWHDLMIIEQTWRSSERNESICGPKLDYNILQRGTAMADDPKGRSQQGVKGRGEAVVKWGEGKGLGCTFVSWPAKRPQGRRTQRGGSSCDTLRIVKNNSK